MKNFALISSLLVLTACSHPNGWTNEQAGAFRKKIALGEFLSSMMPNNISEKYADCVMDKIMADYKYKELINLEKSDSAAFEAKIEVIEEACWESTLKENINAIKSKGVDVVIPED